MIRNSAEWFAKSPLILSFSPRGEGTPETASAVILASSLPPHPLADAATLKCKLAKASFGERDRVRGDLPKRPAKFDMRESALPPFIEVTPIAWRAGEAKRTRRAIPEETPIAVTFDGSSYAVMMATPQDLEDFAVGFALTEEVIDAPDDIESMEIVESGDGIEARMWLKQRRVAAPARAAAQHSRPHGLRALRQREHRASLEAGADGRKRLEGSAPRACGGDGRAADASGLEREDARRSCRRALCRWRHYRP